MKINKKQENNVGGEKKKKRVSRSRDEFWEKFHVNFYFIVIAKIIFWNNLSHFPKAKEKNVRGGFTSFLAKKESEEKFIEIFGDNCVGFTFTKPIRDKVCLNICDIMKRKPILTDKTPPPPPKCENCVTCEIDPDFFQNLATLPEHQAFWAMNFTSNIKLLEKFLSKASLPFEVRQLIASQRIPKLAIKEKPSSPSRQSSTLDVVEIPEPDAPAFCQPNKRYAVLSINEIFVEEGIFSMGNDTFCRTKKISVSIFDLINEDGTTNPSIYSILPVSSHPNAFTDVSRHLYNTRRIRKSNAIVAASSLCQTEVIAKVCDGGRENACFARALLCRNVKSLNHQIDLLLYHLSPRNGEHIKILYRNNNGQKLSIDITRLREMCDQRAFYAPTNDLSKLLVSMWQFSRTALLNASYGGFIKISENFYSNLLFSLTTIPSQALEFNGLIRVTQILNLLRRFVAIVDLPLTDQNLGVIKSLVGVLNRIEMPRSGNLINEFISTLKTIISFYNCSHINFKPSIFSVNKLYAISAQLRVENHFREQKAKIAANRLCNFPPNTATGGVFQKDKIIFYRLPQQYQTAPIDDFPITPFPLITQDHLMQADNKLRNSRDFMNQERRNIAQALAIREVIWASAEPVRFAPIEPVLNNTLYLIS